MEERVWIHLKPDRDAPGHGLDEHRFGQTLSFTSFQRIELFVPQVQ